MTVVVDSPPHRQTRGSSSQRRRHHKGTHPARRDVIVDAAINLTDAGGLDALSMSTLAKRVGISRALLYTVFKNRDALRVAVHLQLEQQFLADLRRGAVELSGLQQIQHAFRAHSNWLKQSRAYRELCCTTMFAGMLWSPDTPRLQFIQSALRLGAADGSIRGDLVAPNILCLIILGWILSSPSSIRGASRPGAFDGVPLISVPKVPVFCS